MYLRYVLDLRYIRVLYSRRLRQSLEKGKDLRLFFSLFFFFFLTWVGMERTRLPVYGWKFRLYFLCRGGFWVGYAIYVHFVHGANVFFFFSFSVAVEAGTREGGRVNRWVYMICIAF